MSDKDGFKERERALEESYFLKKEKELIEKMRRRTQLDAQRDKLAEETGVSNEEILQSLLDLGYTPETVRLLHIMPLIHIAWANGKVAGRERKMIIEVARASGIVEGSEADAKLQTLLEEAPSPEVWEANLLALRAILESAPREQQAAMRQDLISYSTALASLSRGLLGFDTKISAAEREALAEVIKELAPPENEAARKILES